MLKETIKYVDFNGEEREEDFYFNLTQAEVTEMEMSTQGGLGTLLQEIVKSKDQAKIIETFKDVILRSHGVKSPDGKRFIKNQEVRDAFVQTEAYSVLFMKLATNADAAVTFVNGIMPKVPTN